MNALLLADHHIVSSSPPAGKEEKHCASYVVQTVTGTLQPSLMYTDVISCVLVQTSVTQYLNNLYKVGLMNDE